MGKFQNVLITTDYDGTFANDQGRIIDSVRNAIRYFISEGGRFTVSTGRTYQGFHKYDPTYINAPVLLCNGAMAYDYHNQEVVFCNGIAKEDALVAAKRLTTAFPDVPLEMYPFNSTFAIHLNDESERHFTNQNIAFTEIDDAIRSEFPWVKAMLNAKDKSAEIQEFISDCHFNGVAYLPTSGSYIELLAPGVNKGSGLLQLAARIGVAPENTYAVGDDYNDIEMLQAAALAFVPENGSDIAKQHADYIVRSNNDGCIAHVIEILDTIY